MVDTIVSVSVSPNPSKNRENFSLWSVETELKQYVHPEWVTKKHKILDKGGNT
jgi:hypothetical protein